MGQATLEPRITEPYLSDEEIRVLATLATGMTSDVVARRLQVSSRTVRRRVRSACEQLGVTTTMQAVVLAAKRGLI